MSDGEATLSGVEGDERAFRFQRFVIDSLPTAVVTVDSEFRVTGINPWAERMLGYRSEEAKGKFCSDLLKGGMCDGRCPLRAAVNGLKPISLVETTVRNRRGDVIPVRMSTAALLDDQGALIGGVESFQDISRLKQLERERDNLISMFAHDLKSSISIIGGFVLRLLKRDNSLSDVKQNEYLHIVKKEVSHLDSLVNSFLEFSRLLAGRIKLDLAVISLDKELLELVDAYQVRASNAGIGIRLEADEPLPLIKGDSQHLRRVFTNLLDNAIKFSKADSTVTLSMGESVSDVIIEVRDEGIGIPPDDLPHIFDAYGRGRQSGGTKGFGLGLAGAKRIVDAHGGHLEVKSESGKGSTFTVILPKTQQPGSAS